MEKLNNNELREELRRIVKTTRVSTNYLCETYGYTKEEWFNLDTRVKDIIIDADLKRMSKINKELNKL